MVFESPDPEIVTTVPTEPLVGVKVVIFGAAAGVAGAAVPVRDSVCLVGMAAAPEVFGSKLIVKVNGRSLLEMLAFFMASEVIATFATVAVESEVNETFVMVFFAVPVLTKSKDCA